MVGGQCYRKYLPFPTMTNTTRLHMSESTKLEIEPILADGSAPATSDEVIAALDKLGIANSTITHAPMRTVADSMALRDGVPGGYSKNLFLRNKKGIMIVVTMLEDRTINLAALGEKLNMGKLSFASPERMMKYLGVIPGAVTPLCVINDKNVVVTAVLDKALLDMTTTISADGLLKYMEAYHNKPLIVDFVCSCSFITDRLHSTFREN